MITEFSAWEGLAGGTLIGLSAVLLMLFKGRIAGISGILSGVLDRGDQVKWQLAFIIGLIISWPIYRLFGEPIPFQMNSNLLLIICAGLLVGLGTRWGNGCTSGHGVCGMSRGSTRSIVATAVFMGVAILTVWLKQVATGDAL